VERVTIDRVQQMIDDEAAQRFPAGAVTRLVLLQYGDHPVVEPGEVYLRVIFGQDLATPDAWMDVYGERLEDFRAQRLPEVKGLVFTTDDTDTAARRPAGIMKMDDLSLLDREEDELARGLTPVMALLGSADLVTLDALTIAGIAASRAQSVRWCLARIREQPMYAKLSERPREPGALEARAGMDQAVRDQLQSRLDAQVKERFPDGRVQRVALVRYGDDPEVEPGDLMVRVVIGDAGEDPLLPAWERDHEAMIRELPREVAEQVPGSRHLEFCFGGDTGRQGRIRHRLGGSADDPAGRERDLTPVGVRVGLADLEMLDTLITAGIAASRAEAIRWVLARIRERPAYAKLSERARELDELKARF
jgi:hypothetical protein